MPQPCRLVVLISGTGSNLQALIDACNKGQILGEIVAVISNRPDVAGLKRAETAHIPAITIDHRQFTDRATFDQALMQAIDRFAPDAVLLAGFMRILTTAFTRHYLGRMFNIHPSRLPKFRGLNTHQRALDAGETEHGASIHFVTEELDGGPVVLQSRLQISPQCTPDTLAAEVLKQEHVLYPLAVQWFCEGRLKLVKQQPVFDQQPLHSPLQLEELISENQA